MRASRELKNRRSGESEYQIRSNLAEPEIRLNLPVRLFSPFLAAIDDVPVVLQRLGESAISKIPSLCAVSVRITVLGLAVNGEAGNVVERTALGWTLASQKQNAPPPGVVRN